MSGQTLIEKALFTDSFVCIHRTEFLTCVNRERVFVAVNSVLHFCEQRVNEWKMALYFSSPDFTSASFFTSADYSSATFLYGDKVVIYFNQTIRPQFTFSHTLPKNNQPK